MSVSAADAIADALYPDQPAPSLDADAQIFLSRLRKLLALKRRRNRMLERRYDAKHSTRFMDLSIPPQLPNVNVVLGWGAKVVDTIEERIDFRGWDSIGDDDTNGLDDIYTDNDMPVESSRAHVDALLFGVGFVALGTGDPDNDEPEILITAESSLRSTMLWDYRARRAAAGYTSSYDERHKLVMETLYLPNSTYTINRDPVTGQATVADRDDHNLGRVPMVRLVNRDRASNPHGRSEITPAVRYLTDASVRTMLGMEVNREFYTVPMTFALNVRPESFGVKEGMTPEQRAALGWKIISGHINLVPPTEAGENPPDIKQLEPHPPTPYLEQVKGYAQMLSAETGIPVNYLGIPSDIAPSGDSIIQAEYPMVRRAERRIVGFNRSWRELAYLALLWRDGNVAPDDFRKIRCCFGDPSTPTRSARADEAQKLVASQVLVPDSKVTYDRIGLTDEEQAQLVIDKGKYAAKQLALAQAAVPPPGGPNPGPVTLNGNQGTPAAAPNPNNVQRGTTIAQQSGQG